MTEDDPECAGHATGGYTPGGGALIYDTGGPLAAPEGVPAGVVHHAECWVTDRQYEALRHTGIFDGMAVHTITREDLDDAEETR